MQIKIYQINPERGVKKRFLSLDALECMQGNRKVAPEIYDLVFAGEVNCRELEEVYSMFNLNPPKEYHGRSLSVSDVVKIEEGESSRFYFCDSIGFAEISFDENKTK